MVAILAIAIFVATGANAARADSTLPGGTFTDDDGNVHEGYIEAIADAGITKGCNPPSNYRYCPDQSVTRGQMAAFLVRALELPGATSDSFSDDESSIFESEINALAAAGVTKGCNPPKNSSFCADEPVTRGQMAAFLVRAFDFVDGAGRDNFTDDNESTFETDIDRLAAAGATQGCNPPDNTRYCPDEPVKRDQMATFLGRSLSLTPMDPPPSGDRIVIASDTLIENETLVLRPGQSIEFRNEAELMIGKGASVDWQGTSTPTWSDDGLTQNLRRDVRIFGEGDITFMTGSLASTLRYVEIDLQPSTELNHYPLHWHFVGDGARGTLVEGVVVKNSTNRAYVPHASHGITFRETIAKNIAGDAYWWNPPPQNDPRFDQSNNSNGILFDKILADGVTNLPGDPHGHRLSAVVLGAGLGNAIRDSVARNIDPAVDRDCSGFHWPNNNVHQPGTWEVDTLKTFGSKCHGLFFWQNTGNAHHLIDGFTSSEGIKHGPYTTDVEYRNIDVPWIVAQSRSWTVSSGRVDEVRARKHKFEGSIRFEHVDVGALVVNNALDGGHVPGHYIFIATGLDCTDVTWGSWVPGTTVTTDGTDCSPPG